MDEFIRLYYSLNTLRENQEMLMNYYVSQYDREFYEYLQERSNKTIYLLESPPDYTFRFLKENERYASDMDLEQTEKIAQDYSYLRDILRQQAEEDLCSTFLKYHPISLVEYFDKREFILSNMDHLPESFSCYQERCHKLNLMALKEEEIFKQFSKEVLKIRDAQYVNLLTQSLWGKAIRESFLQSGVKMSDEVFSYILRLDKKKVAHCINFNSYILVYLPVIQLYFEGGYVDRTFLHENRHVVEAGNGYQIGVNKGLFHYFNEFRTEKHAIEDNQVLPTIFSKKGDDDVCFLYEQAFPLLGTLLEKYQYVIDQCAIDNNIEKLLKTFGRKDLLEYVQLLNQSYQLIKNSSFNGESYSINPNVCLRKVKKLMKNADRYLRR